MLLYIMLLGFYNSTILLSVQFSVLSVIQFIYKVLNLTAFQKSWFLFRHCIVRHPKPLLPAPNTLPSPPPAALLCYRQMPFSIPSLPCQRRSLSVCNPTTHPPQHPPYLPSSSTDLLCVTTPTPFSCLQQLNFRGNSINSHIGWGLKP